MIILKGFSINMQKNLVVNRRRDEKPRPLFASKSKQSAFWFIFGEGRMLNIATEMAHKERLFKSAIIYMTLIIGVCMVAVGLFIAGEYTGFRREQADDSIVLAMESETDLLKKLVVVNSESPIPDGYDLRLVDLPGHTGVECDAAMAGPLCEMLTGAKNAGYELLVEQAYVTPQEQDKLYEAELARLINEQGCSYVVAQDAAKKVVPRGGGSEYQTGLLVNIAGGYEKSRLGVDSDVYRWLIKNCVQYGFVLRYPNDKQQRTGRDFAPGCYRYVGCQSAKKMRSFNMCLEEYRRYCLKKGI